MTDIEALRARMREAAEMAMAATSDNWFHGEYSDIEYAPPAGDENGAHWFPLADELAPAVCDYLIAAQPSATIALDAYTTRLRDDLDRVTRERDEAREGLTDTQSRADGYLSSWDESRKRHLAAEAALAKRDEEVAKLRGALENLEGRASAVCAASARKSPLGWFIDEMGKAIIAARYALGVLKAPEALTQEPTNAE